jgi:hypothetical protein
VLALDFHWALFSLPTPLTIAGVTGLYEDDAELYGRSMSLKAGVRPSLFETRAHEARH